MTSSFYLCLLFLSVSVLSSPYTCNFFLSLTSLGADSIVFVSDLQSLHWSGPVTGAFDSHLVFLFPVHCGNWLFHRKKRVTSAQTKYTSCVSQQWAYTWFQQLRSSLSMKPAELLMRHVDLDKVVWPYRCMSASSLDFKWPLDVFVSLCPWWDTWHTQHSVQRTVCTCKLYL